MTKEPAATAMTLADLDRRAFLRTAGRYSFWGLTAVLLGSTARRAAGETPPTTRPPLDAPPWACTPGFGATPRTEEQEVVAAIIDTVLPGAASDPSGEVGALEAGALELAYDRYYPLRDYIPAIVLLVQTRARADHGAAFEILGREEREAVLRHVQDSLPFLRHAYRFIRSVYFADLHGCVGSRALGFPGPNLGYVHHPEFSYRRAMCEERTPDGIMP